MKISKDQLRQIIAEELRSLAEAETAQEQRQNAIVQISNLLVRLEAQGINAQEVIDQATAAYEKNEPQTNNSQMSSAQMGERKLTKAEKDKKEEIAQAMEEDDPDIDMSKKMAIATSQAKISA